jgi:SAM-dependent methyltransferase
VANYYDEAFYRYYEEGSSRSALEVLPYIVELIRPRRVIDVGCGVATWLAMTSRLGVSEVTGVDGNYVDRRLLRIPEDRFIAHDLTTPLRLDATFDLAISLEVGEHLPAGCAGIYVDSLVRLAPIILFSAAIPGQGGTNHINEQWPEYWAKLFEDRGYVAIDCVRGRFWKNKNIEEHYRQNMLLFGEESYVRGHPALATAFEQTIQDQLSIVLPEQFLRCVDYREGRSGFRTYLAPMGSAFVRAFRKRTRKVRKRVRALL